MQLIIKEPLIAAESITAQYIYDGTEYTHSFLLPGPLDAHDPAVVCLTRWLAIIHAGYLFSIEYFTDLVTEFALSADEIAFFEKVFFNGMAEFRYVNNIPPGIQTSLRSIITTENVTTPVSSAPLSGRLLLNGGGKDGLTSAILLQEAGLDFDLFQIGRGTSQSRAASNLDKHPYVAKRLMDKRQFGAKYAGHRPTSAAIAIMASLTAYILGKRDVIASNEASADEISLHVDGFDINHQYSKSHEFEKDYAALLQASGISVRYFSLLRPLHELQIIKIFADHGKFDNFISCNHGFRKGFWCLHCAKCAFIALGFGAIAPALADRVLSTNQAITARGLFKYIEALVEPALNKPLECVGTLRECQIAAKLILTQGEPLPPHLEELFIRVTADVTADDIKTLMTRTKTNKVLPDEYRPIDRIIARHLSTAPTRN